MDVFQLDKKVKEKTVEYLNHLFDIYGVQDRKRCEDYARRILNHTAHIPTVSSIAIAAARCTYYARLMSLGVRVPYRDFFSNIPGKGFDVHKIIGLAILLMKNDGKLSVEYIEGKVNEAYHILEKLNLLYSPKYSGEMVIDVIQTSIDLIYRLLSNLPLFSYMIGTSPEKLDIIVEQLFMSYPLHMKGSPDLILEDPRKRVAIVVDWKTGDEPVWDTDKAQIYAYALMEAVRLGYQQDELIDVVMGELRNNTITGVKILPVIVRVGERREFLPHPILAKSGYISKRYQKGKELLEKIIKSAGFLTLISSNHRKLGIDTSECKAYIRGKIKTNLLRRTPENEPKLPRGYPVTQSSFPCVARKNGKKKIICKLASPCKVYYGPLSFNKTDVEAVIWDIRFRVWDAMEESLYIYKALEFLFYGSGKNWALKNLIDYKGFDVYLDNGYVDVSADRKKRKTILIHTMYMSGERKKPIKRRYDIVYEVDLKDKNSLTLRRELIDGIDVATVEDIRIWRTVSKGRTALISLLDGPTPMLSINFHGRIDEVRLEPYDNTIEYKVSAPSRLLRYQLEIFKQYLKNREEGEPIFIVEADMDLTNIELSALDAIQRTLRQEGYLGDEDTSDLQNIIGEIWDNDSLLDIISIIARK